MLLATGMPSAQALSVTTCRADADWVTMVGYVIGFTGLSYFVRHRHFSDDSAGLECFTAASRSRAQAVVAVDVTLIGRGGRRSAGGRQPGSARVLPDQWHGHLGILGQN